MTVNGEHKIATFDFSDIPSQPKWMGNDKNGNIQYYWHKPSYSSKPSWDSAPSWANWLAMDGNGIWYWYENEPYQIQDRRTWNNSEYSKFLHAGHSPTDIIVATDWEDSLERRPGHDQ